MAVASETQAAGLHWSGNLLSKYDAIVVGAGTAGLALATRLTEDTSKNVLILEAGPGNYKDPMVLTPPFAPQLWKQDKYDYAYMSTPQKGYAGREILQNRGKGLGGTSSINLRMFAIPNKASIDAWGQLGNQGWTFDELAPYYKKASTFHEPGDDMKRALGLDYLDQNLHGKDGPIQVSYGNFSSEHDRAFVKAFESLGYKSKADPQSGLHYGVYNPPCTVDPATSTRSYAGLGYLSDDVLARPNLRIVTEARVQSLIVNTNANGDGPDGRPATVIEGVRFADAMGTSLVAYAVETILAAGVFHSPQLLELSGIGNPDILRKAGIEPIVDLPGVGENLQDHANVGISFESAIPTLDSFRDEAALGAAFGEYTAHKTGPLSSSIYCASYMPLLEPESGNPVDVSKLITQHLSANPPISPAVQKQFDLIGATISDPSRSSIEYLLAPIQMNPEHSSAAAALPDDARAADYITIFSSLSHPFSRGTVHVRSGDPAAPPTIDPAYLSHPLDREIVARHLMYLDKVVRAGPLASVLKPGGRRIPEGIDLMDWGQVAGAVSTGFTTYHPSGTCAMMPREMGGVVDERLRVYGCAGLRVVDASVFPMQIRGGLQATVYAVAERAAEWIGAEWSGASGC